MTHSLFYFFPVWVKIRGPAIPACCEGVTSSISERSGDALKIPLLVWAWTLGGTRGGEGGREGALMDFCTTVWLHHISTISQHVSFRTIVRSDSVLCALSRNAGQCNKKIKSLNRVY